MVDFEALAREKQKNMLVAAVTLCCTFILLVRLNGLVCFGIVLGTCIYIFGGMPYCILLSLFGLSKKVAEKVQQRAQILKGIYPSDDFDYDYSIDSVLLSPHFAKEQDIQNHVETILTEYDVANDDKEALKKLQKEISTLCDAYKRQTDFICKEYWWWKKLYFRKFDPFAALLGDENIELLRAINK